MTAPVRVGSYRIERLLGAGSFATVWLGHDPGLDSYVAIKVLAENWSHDLRVRERFLDEARLLRRLDHERLIRVYSVGELADGRPYSVMAWADGGSLRDRLARGPVPVPDALQLLGEIAAGVAVLHRHGVVHRDLTPGNILFQSRPGDMADGHRVDNAHRAERVLIADLGLAKALAAASGLTARAGTPGYMAPEQDEPFAMVDARADVFGLGRLGIRLLSTGGGRSTGGLRLREGVPQQVLVVLRTATAHQASGRYPDAAAFRAALRCAAPDAVPGHAVAKAEGRPTQPTGPTGSGRRAGTPPRRVLRRLGLAAATIVWIAGTGATTAADTAPVRAPASVPVAGSRVTVALPPGWQAFGDGWAGQYDGDGELEPGMVISPRPRRWLTDPTVPGAFIGISAATAARTTPARFLAERPHAECVAAPTRQTRQGSIDWTVASFACDGGSRMIVEAAGLGPGDTGLVYAQIVPPAGGGTDFADRLLAGIRVR